MKDELDHKVIRHLMVPLILLLMTAGACKKEEPPRGQTATQPVNPYTTDSVFDEVKKKLEKSPDDVDTLYHLADLYERNSQYGEAIETYKKVVRVKPDAGYAYFKMGTAYDRLNRPAEAITEFTKAVKYLPEYPVLYNNLGVAYGKTGKFDDEIAALRKAISLRPTYSAARYNLAVTHLKTGNKKAAMQEYESLKKFDEGAAAALLKEIRGSS